MLLDGFDLKIQKVPYFDQSVAYGGPTKRGVSQGGDPTGLELGAGRVEVALTRGQTKAGSHPDDLA